MRRVGSFLWIAVVLAACSGAAATPTVPVTVVATAAPSPVPAITVTTGPQVTAPAATPAVTPAPAITPTAVPTETAAAPTIAPTASPTPEPTIAPTAAGPLPAEVTRFYQIGTDVTVQVHNPNADLGLVRSSFELAVIAENGDVLAVVSGGLPGTLCCTIFQLPPGMDYYLIANGLPDKSKAASVELTILGDWVTWSTLQPATATVSNAHLKVEFDYPTLTGRVSVDQPGPFNVVVTGVIEGANDSFSAIVDSGPDCMGGSQTRAFQVSAFSAAPKEPKLGDVFAYVTTVPGAGDVDTPPGC